MALVDKIQSISVFSCDASTQTLEDENNFRSLKSRKSQHKKLIAEAEVYIIEETIYHEDHPDFASFLPTSFNAMVPSTLAAAAESY
ncbi:hypothetical protein HK096_005671, partial [Nowakowskiella sp. JEL0078]